MHRRRVDANQDVAQFNQRREIRQAFRAAVAVAHGWLVADVRDNLFDDALVVWSPAEQYFDVALRAEKFDQFGPTLRGPGLEDTLLKRKFGCAWVNDHLSFLPRHRQWC